MGEFPSKKDQFKPGQSGNPGGRARGLIGRRVRKLLKEGNKELLDQVAMALIEHAIKNENGIHMRVLFDRVDGAIHIGTGDSEAAADERSTLVLGEEYAKQLREQLVEHANGNGKKPK